MILKIKVVLPKDRLNYGHMDLYAEDDSYLAGPFKVDGKSDNQSALAHGNPSRIPSKPFGDTPTGLFNGYLETKDLTAENERSYGKPYDIPNKIPLITLIPISGEAVSADGANLRPGVAIHFGALNGSHEMRPTHGCVRGFEPEAPTFWDTVFTYKPKSISVLITEQ